MKLSLQQKILFGYIALIIVIIGMAMILISERIQLKSLKDETYISPLNSSSLHYSCKIYPYVGEFPCLCKVLINYKKLSRTANSSRWIKRWTLN